MRKCYLHSFSDKPNRIAQSQEKNAKIEDSLNSEWFGRPFVSAAISFINPNDKNIVPSSGILSTPWSSNLNNATDMLMNPCEYNISSMLFQTHSSDYTTDMLINPCDYNISSLLYQMHSSGCTK